MSAAGGEYGEKKVQMNQKERHKDTKWLQKKKINSISKNYFLDCLTLVDRLWKTAAQQQAETKTLPAMFHVTFGSLSTNKTT